MAPVQGQTDSRQDECPDDRPFASRFGLVDSSCGATIIRWLRLEDYEGLTIEDCRRSKE